MKIIYHIYQLCIALPLMALATILTALATSIGCLLGGGKFWGYYPPHWWSIFVVRILFLSVSVEGRGNEDKNQSYVFVANHQSAMDIFLIYGFLNHQFRWMMKKSLEKIPFVGRACRISHQIFVDRDSKSGIADTIASARKILQSGMSLTVFPEGTRTDDGHLHRFHNGAFVLADELQKPVIPLTIDGAYDVLPKSKGFNFVKRHRMRLVIHKPIFPTEQGRRNIVRLSNESFEAIGQSLPQGTDKE